MQVVAHREKRPDTRSVAVSQQAGAGLALVDSSIGGQALARAFPGRAWCAQPVWLLFRASPAFAYHVLSQGPDYIHVLALAHLDVARLPETVDERIRFLASSTRKHILERTVGVVFGLHGLLHKLGTRVLPRENYEFLLTAMRDERLNKALRHCNRVNGPLLHAMRGLPAAYAQAKVLRGIRSAAEAGCLVAAVTTAERMLGAAARARIVGSFARLEAPKNLVGWIDGLCANLQFPEPPWPGTTQLEPIRSPRMLKRIADRFKNCADKYRYRDGILLGTYYFYYWHDVDQPVLVFLERHAYLGWVVREMRRPRNRLVKAHQERAIRATFAQCPTINAEVSVDDLEMEDSLWR